MSFTDAYAFALSLASTLMVAIVIFRAGDGTLAVPPAGYFAGDVASSLRKSAPVAL